MLSKKSFTLVEMLLVTSLLAMTGLAIYHSIANGLKIWQFSNRYAQEEDIAIIFDKLSQDFRNSFNHSLIKFEGKEHQLSFATQVRTLADSAQAESSDYVPQIGRVEYEFDSGTKTLLRRQANYGQAMANDFDPARPLIHPVMDVNFSYYFTDSIPPNFQESTMEKWPAGVLVEIKLGGEGEKAGTLSKFIFIPSGNKS